MAMRLGQINRLKKKITFGNIPHNYHALSTSIAMAEGMTKYGFDNSLDTLLNKENWNLDYLGGHKTAVGEIICETAPRISLYKLFTPEGLEIHCIPWIRNEEFNFELQNRPEMDFKHWIPATMKVVFKIVHLHTFIYQYFDHGDEADLALIKHAHAVVENFVEQTALLFNTQKNHGVSVGAFFEYVEKKRKSGEEVLLPTVYNIRNNREL
jgi:hypothetical protein